jgi:hypothetical protein
MARGLRLEVAVRVVAVVFIVGVLPSVYWGDPNHYWDVGRVFSIHRLPYRQVPWEFPPLTVPFATLASLMSRKAYVLVFGLLMAAIELWSLERLRSSLGRQHNINVAWYCMVAPLAPVLWFRFDALLLPCLVVALVGASTEGQGRGAASGALVAGFALKLWPPVLALATRGRGNRELVRVVLGVAMVVAGWWAWSPSGFQAFLEFRRGRGYHIESTVGSVMTLAGRRPYVSSLSWVVGGGSSGWPEVLATALWAVAALGLAVVAHRRRAELVDYGGAVVTLLLVSSRLLSPQYLCWLIPFVAVVAVNRRRRVVRVASVVAVLTCAELAFYPAFTRGSGAVAALVVVRNMLLLVLAWDFVSAVVRGTVDARPRQGDGPGVGGSPGVPATSRKDLAVRSA